MYEKGAIPPDKVEYELFYLEPRQPTDDLDERAEFVSEFLFGSKKAETGRFWMIYHDTTEFIEAPDDRAERYIAAYKLEGFSRFYDNPFHYKDHKEQLSGLAGKDRLTLKTSEMDDTVFLMRVRAPAFKPRYYVTNFLGGCRGDFRSPAIRMQAVLPKPCK
jgi:hypothetical protein